MGNSSNVSSRLLQIAVLSVLVFLSLPTFSDIGIRVSKDKVYTLYRDSALDKSMRIHVATFDADASQAYNKENCEIARDLFEGQPGVTVTYWCEKGYYRE